LDSRFRGNDESNHFNRNNVYRCLKRHKLSQLKRLKADNEAKQGYKPYCYNSFNKQKVLGYKTPLETVKAWYHKNPLLFHDTHDINAYILAKPNT